MTRRNVEDWEHRGILCCYSINTEELVASIGKKEEIACVMACYAATCTYLVLLWYASNCRMPHLIITSSASIEVADIGPFALRLAASAQQAQWMAGTYIT